MQTAMNLQSNSGEIVTKEKSPLYLVDGSGYIFRAFYAITPLSNSAGLPTNALLGFTRMMVKLLRDFQAKYVAVAFDTETPTFRHQMYDQYKANRKECPKELIPQLPYFRKVISALGIKGLEKPGFEADDIIATLAVHLQTPQQKIIIVSGDKDLTQLVNDNIEVWDGMRDIHYDFEGVKGKFEVTPDQMIDYLTLVGDTSDNVPGVKGIGPKTASALLLHFGSLEQVLKNLDRLEEVKGLRGVVGIRGKLELALDQLRLSKQLVTLDKEVKPFDAVNSVEEFSWIDINPELAGPLFGELEFDNVFKSLKVSSLPAQNDKNLQVSKKFELINRENLQNFIDQISKAKAFALDTETTSLNTLDCELVGISFSWSEDQAFYLPLGGKADKEKQLDLNTVRELLKPVLENPEIKKFGSNIKFDLNVLAQHGFQVAGVEFDSMIASYIVNPDKRQHGLKNLAKIYLEADMKTFEEVVGEAQNIGEVPIKEVYQYACFDANSSWCLKFKLDPLLGDTSLSNVMPSLRYVFEKVEMPIVPVLSAMERAGIKVDLDYLGSLGKEFGSDLARLELEIHKLSGFEFNINSPKQLSTVLFEKLGLPTHGVKSKQSGYSTDAKVLNQLAPDYEIVRLLLDYRELHKLQTTYVEALKRLVNAKTGRVHTSFNQSIAATGRLSSSEPNLQNIPIKNPKGRRLRHAFIAEPGYLLISADYSQIELRVLAHLSGDKALTEAFKKGEDIHLATAKELFGPVATLGQDVEDLRRIAKTINFGIIYGMGAFRLASELKVTRQQAKKYIDSYFDRYSGVRSYFDQLAKNAEESGFVESLCGRRRYVKDIDTAGRDVGYAQRSMINAPIQGSAADIIKVAMIGLSNAINEANLPARLVLQVHDELVLEVKENAAEKIEKLVVSQMESAISLTVPLRVDTRISNTWGDS